MMFLQKLAVLLTVLGVALASTCQYSNTFYSTNFISKSETVDSVSACVGTTSITQSVTLYANASADASIYLCKESKAFLKLSEVFLVQPGKITEETIGLGSTSPYHDIAICKTGSDKVLFNELRLTFEK